MIDRAKDAEAAWQAVIEDDPLHPRPHDIFHDASLELLKLYSTEDRWEDAYVVLWNAYENAAPGDMPTLLSMRLRSEMERVAPEETVPRLERYVAADPTDWEALRPWPAPSRRSTGRPRPGAISRPAWRASRGTPGSGAITCWLHEQGDMDAWAALLARVPRAAEGEAEVWRFRGLLKEKAGDWAGAAEDYRAALRLNPYVLAHHYRLAMVEERLGHREQAAEHRRRSEGLRAAREQLRTAFTDFVAAREQGDAGRASLKASMKRLASVCEALGWSRLASAWEQLASAS